MARGTRTVRVARSAGTGKFVKLSYAAKHPQTTVVEVVKVPVKKGK